MSGLHISGGDPRNHEIAVRTLAELERIYGYKLDGILPDGTHRYWSTHCRHDNHEACSASEISGWLLGVRTTAPVNMPRKPAQCKTCASPCICPCHAPVGSSEVTDGR